MASDIIECWKASAW